MADEVPISLKTKRGKHVTKRSNSDVQELECIIHSHKNNSDPVIRPLTQASWEKIQEVRHERLLCEDPPKRQEDICKGIPQQRLVNHGYHRQCYQRFTNIKYIRKRGRNDTDPGVDTTKRRKKASTLFPVDKCIICGKKNKWVCSLVVYMPFRNTPPTPLERVVSPSFSGRHSLVQNHYLRLV